MDDALQRGTAVVAAHRGKVLQYAGDNILAAFGADEVKEDDPERAVRCGLSLARARQDPCRRGVRRAWLPRLRRSGGPSTPEACC